MRPAVAAWFLLLGTTRGCEAVAVFEQCRSSDDKQNRTMAQPFKGIR